MQFASWMPKLHSNIKAAFKTKLQPSMVLHVYALHRLNFPLKVEIVTNII